VDDAGVSDAIEIYRTKSLKLDKNSLVQRTIKITLLSLRMGILVWKKVSKGEIVLLATNPVLLLLLIRVIRLFKKFELHILVHDVFPENTIPAKIFNDNKSIVYKTIKYFFDNAYANADHLIVIGRDMKEIISTKVNRFNTHPVISIVPNWSDPAKFSVNKNKTHEDKRILLQYAGNIGRNQGLMEILDAFRLSKNENLSLNLRGTGALYSYIDNYISTYNLENITLGGGFSRNEENEILADCDVGIVCLSLGMLGLGVPSKSYHLLSAGKPILYIGEPESEISQLVREKGIGWSLDISDQSGMIRFFESLGSVDKDTLIKMGKKARSLAESEYNEPTILELMQSKIESVNSKN
jgi:glycosyltransferase involved in cell wall biosynthesis